MKIAVIVLIAACTLSLPLTQNPPILTPSGPKVYEASFLHRLIDAFCWNCGLPLFMAAGLEFPGLSPLPGVTAAGAGAAGAFTGAGASTFSFTGFCLAACG